MASASELFALGHLAQKFPHKKLCVIYIRTVLGFIMWDVHTNGKNWVSMPRQIAHKLILPQPMSQDGLSPMVSGLCGKGPPIAHTHLATVPNAVVERG